MARSKVSLDVAELERALADSSRVLCDGAAAREPNGLKPVA